MGPSLFLWGDAAHYETYRKAVQAAGGQLCFSREMERGEQCDGLLLPGGGDVASWRYGQADCGSYPPNPEQDQAELALLERFARMKKPVLGICRGMQVINVFFGGTLIQDLPGHNALDGDIDRLHGVCTAPSFLTEICGARGVVNSSHHQAVDRLGAGLRAVQWAPDGVVEALCHETLPVWGVQWHPERRYGPLVKSEAKGESLFDWFLKSV